jgi:hypothetical protein
MTCIRCNIHSVGGGVNGWSYIVIDSYIHDIFGVTNCALFPGDCISHNGAMQGQTGSIVIRHSNLVGTYSSASTGGGMSSALSLYTHGDNWGPMSNVVIERNRFESRDAVYCAYGGDSNEQNPTNIQFVSNTFVRNAGTGTCGTGGPITAWRQGGGNIWSGNVYNDGQPIAEPPTTYG